MGNLPQHGKLSIDGSTSSIEACLALFSCYDNKGAAPLIQNICQTCCLYKKSIYN